MTDPTRLVDEAGGDELELSLLRLARGDAPSAAARQKLLAAVVAAGATSLAAPGARAATTAGKLTKTASWGALAVAAVAIPAAVLLGFRGTGASRAPTSLAAPATVVKAAPLEPVPVTLPAPAPSALPVAAPAPPQPSSAPPVGKGPRASLADEVAQLKKAKSALEGGNPKQALAELGVYSRRFPRPALGAEAAVLRIEALSRSGDSARATALAESFLAKHPNSPYAARLRRLTSAR